MTTHSGASICSIRLGTSSTSLRIEYWRPQGSTHTCSMSLETSMPTKTAEVAVLMMNVSFLVDAGSKPRRLFGLAEMGRGADPTLCTASQRQDTIGLARAGLGG